MTRTLSIITLSLLAAFLTACGGNDPSMPDDKDQTCSMSFDGKPVPCTVTTAPNQG